MLVDDGITAAVASCSVHAHSATATRQRNVIPTPGQKRCTARLPDTQSARGKGPEEETKKRRTEREERGTSRREAEGRAEDERER